MVRSGRSFSGRERHCAYLNLGDGTFANVSALSGLDLPDDGRGVALCDWDQDGDLDLWISNRTGPQIRFFDNQGRSDNDFVAFRLEGTTCNRDAIGARLELHLSDSPVPLIKTLRAGDGFLSQSSKWVHFGIGKEAEISRLVVRWPGGDTRAFSDIRAGGRYRVVQGGACQSVTAPPRGRLEPKEVPARPAPVSSRTFTHVSIPLPKLTHRTPGGVKTKVAAFDRPALVLLWASWCAPCREELRQIVQRRRKIETMGLDVVAVHVGNLATGGAPQDAQSAARFLQEINFPFRSGAGDARLLDIVQVAHDYLFDLHEPLPLPSSVLIDPHGHLHAICKGPLDVDALLGEIQAVSQFPSLGTQRRNFSLPCGGRWVIAGKVRGPLGALAKGLLQKGYLDDARKYTAENRELLKIGNQYADVLFALAQASEKAEKYAEARQDYENVLNESPQHLGATGRLSRLLASCPQEEIRDGARALQLAEDVARATQFQDLEALDILAIAQAENGQFDEAQKTMQQALELARRHEDVSVVEQLKERRRLYESHAPFRLR